VIGKGAFGQVYLSYDLTQKRKVAIKIELPTTKKQVLKLEISILRKLNQASKLENICEFVGGGRFIAPQIDNDSSVYTYMVMNLAGSKY
jgi:serine/threonine protein kinase